MIGIIYIRNRHQNNFKFSRPANRWTLFGLLVLEYMCLYFCFVGVCKKNYCGLNVLLMPMLLAMSAFAVGNMDVKSVDTLIKLFTIPFIPLFSYLSSTPPSQVFVEEIYSDLQIWTKMPQRQIPWLPLQFFFCSAFQRTCVPYSVSTVFQM